MEEYKNLVLMLWAELRELRVQGGEGTCLFKGRVTSIANACGCKNDWEKLLRFISNCDNSPIITTKSCSIVYLTKKGLLTTNRTTVTIVKNLVEKWMQVENKV